MAYGALQVFQAIRSHLVIFGIFEVRVSVILHHQVSRLDWRRVTVCVKYMEGWEWLFLLAQFAVFTVLAVRSRQDLCGVLLVTVGLAIGVRW